MRSEVLQTAEQRIFFYKTSALQKKEEGSANRTAAGRVADGGVKQTTVSVKTYLHN